MIGGQMELTPLGPGFGAEVKGANLIDVASSDVASRRVRAAFEEHSLLLFRGHEVSDDVQAAFSRAFGPLEIVKIGSAGVGTFYSRLNNLAPDGSVVLDTHRQTLVARANQLWHTDSSFKTTPALASVLSSRRFPPTAAAPFIWRRTPSPSKAWPRMRAGRSSPNSWPPRPDRRRYIATPGAPATSLCGTIAPQCIGAALGPPAKRA